MTKQITAKFPGCCIKCNARFAAGTAILWEQGRGSQHVSGCGTVVAVAAKPATRTRTARPENWRCPDPGLCGDPTCDGSCYY